MKLIRWVEVHIGRSRKKAKKTPTKQQGSPRCGDGPSENLARASPSAAAPRLLSGGQSCSRVGNSGRPELHAKAAAAVSLQPQACSLSKLPVAHIRTSFLDQAPMSPADANSPRQRSRIKTNPWIASPRSPCGSSSADSGWAGSRSSTGSEGSEPGDVTSLLLHEPSWRGGHWASLGSLPPARSNHVASLLGASPLRPRNSSTLDRRPSPLIGSSDLRLASATTRRPESARLQRRQTCGRSLFGTRISDNDSSASSDDEAYSEDFLQSEDSSDVVTVVKAAGTPQTDSACDPGSCTTTPLSECSSQLQRTETLADKVRRLRAQRVLVQQKMHEARVEEQASREQRIRLHRELMQFRRLMLLHSLQGLRSDLEQRTACMASSCRGGTH
ncbi:uncharacterized protein LOC144098916 [Amblyomma americanum]